MIGGGANASGTAHAEGNAHVTIWPNKYKPKPSGGSSGSNYDDKYDDNYDDNYEDFDDNFDDIQESMEEFEEIFDWFELRLESINAHLDLMNSKLENAVGITEKGNIIDSMLGKNYYKLDQINQGLQLYSKYANDLLEKIPAKYREMAQDGDIQITEFLGNANEETVEAINNYREWANKVADLNAELEGTKTEISNLRVQSLEMIANEYSNAVGILDAANNQIQNSIDLLDEQGRRASKVMFEEMIENNEEKLKKLQEQRKAMQKEFDEAVASGDVKEGSDAWYEMANNIFEVDDAISGCKSEIEGFQNSINDLHWENFDGIITAIENVEDEIGNLRGLIDDEDVADEFGNWTEKGITALGLEAQAMEEAQYKAELCKKEIDYLNKAYKAGKYSQDEYNEKLKELQDGQWACIEAYESAKKNIIALNKVRVEAVKDGIQKEIDAYSELISKQKEELSAKKEAHDFEKSISEKEKEIASLQKRINAMMGDDSMSSMVERKKLQEELYNAQKELEELYYDHSIEEQQKALDESLENYEKEKNDEIEALDKYLENENQVISDSYDTIVSNTESVANTLAQMAEQYGVTLSESITSPWKDGMDAIGEYKENLTTATSAFTDQLKSIRKELVDLQKEADKTGKKLVENINSSVQDTLDQNYTKQETAKKDEPKKETPTIERDVSYGKASETSGYIQNGSSGKDVKAIQFALNQLGYGNNGTKDVDGIFGSGTEAAVKQFQKARKITADGIVGDKTRMQFKLKGYAIGSKKIKNDGLAILDELGEELVLNVSNGRLQYLSKGSGVIPADMTENLMAWGELDPSMMLERNRPKADISNICNNNMEINMSIAEVVHIDSATSDSVPEIADAVQKQIDKYMKRLNQSIKRYSR